MPCSGIFSPGLDLQLWHSLQHYKPDYFLNLLQNQSFNVMLILALLQVQLVQVVLDTTSNLVTV